MEISRTFRWLLLISIFTIYRAYICQDVTNSGVVLWSDKSWWNYPGLNLQYVKTIVDPWAKSIVVGTDQQRASNHITWSLYNQSVKTYGVGHLFFHVPLSVLWTVNKSRRIYHQISTDETVDSKVAINTPSIAPTSLPTFFESSLIIHPNSSQQYYCIRMCLT